MSAHVNESKRSPPARAAGLSAWLLWPLAALASDPTPPAPAAAHPVSWAEVARWPDFTGGQWVIKGSLVNTPAQVGAPLKPGLTPAPPAGGAANGCAPHGMPSLVGGEFFYAGNSILLVVDFDYLVFRRIYMDGRAHGDPDPTYFGHSVGHWEGKTLVVDTIGFLPEVTLAGVPGKGATHIVERYEPVDRDTLHLIMTIENPEILSEPWVIRKTLVRLPKLDVREAFCQQNDRNAPVDGHANTDLTPPP